MPSRCDHHVINIVCSDTFREKTKIPSATKNKKTTCGLGYGRRPQPWLQSHLWPHSATVRILGYDPDITLTIQKYIFYSKIDKKILLVLIKWLLTKNKKWMFKSNNRTVLVRASIRVKKNTYYYMAFNIRKKVFLYLQKFVILLEIFVLQFRVWAQTSKCIITWDSFNFLNKF